MMHRRRFFHWCSVLLSWLAVAFVAVPGMGFLADPLFRNRKAEKKRRLLKLNDLEIGVPRKMMIVDRRTDAWTRYPEGPIGSVWVVRRDESTVEVYSTICPHLGCQVDHAGSDNGFYCPCHEASYKSDGSIVSGPQQRGLDRLNTVVEKVGDEDWVSVVYQRFEMGIAEKIPLG